ncbi:MAG: hypothetical protein P8Y51_07705 [Campylobacterales bacterium]
MSTMTAEMMPESQYEGAVRLFEAFCEYLGDFRYRHRKQRNR